MTKRNLNLQKLLDNNPQVDKKVVQERLKKIGSGDQVIKKGLPVPSPYGRRTASISDGFWSDVVEPNYRPYYRGL